MKLYLESLRKLMRVGLTLLALCVIATVVTALRYCTMQANTMPSVIQMFPALTVYAFVGGLGLAFSGFSFLTKRTDSDFYHSLPVKRSALFCSITLAALTWISATVVLSLVAGTVVFLMARVAFVPAYPLLALPFYIVSAMLVFAAGAIACSLTGTLLSNAALTAVVLFLPRFIQFVVARGLIAGAQIIEWLDLPWFLNPCSNIATGQIVMLSRLMLQSRILDWRYIAYSTVLLVAELLLARLLFVRRNSEIAGQGAKNRTWQTVYACLLVLPVVLLFAARVLIPNTQNLLIVGASALAGYAVYQIVTLRNAKGALRSLIWFLAPAALAVGMFFGVWNLARNAQATVPQQSRVAYVTFPAQDRIYSVRSYAGMQTETIRFTDDATIAYTLEALQKNANSYAQWGYYDDADYNVHFYSAFLPVTIVLTNGRRIGRTIQFDDVLLLNELRERNAEYAAVIRSLPPMESIRYRQGLGQSDKRYGESYELMRSFYNEVAQTGVVPYSNYRDLRMDDGKDEKQAFGSLTLGGYVGMQRYFDFYDILLETPKTCSVWMTQQNDISTDVAYTLLSQIVNASEHFVGESDSFNAQFYFYNAPSKDGGKQATGVFGYAYARNPVEDGMKPGLMELLKEIVEILSRSKMTNDPTAFCAYAQWSGKATAADGTYIGYNGTGYAATAGNAVPGSRFISSNGVISTYSDEGMLYSFNPSYRAFSPEDEARLIEILREWYRIEQSWTYVDENGVEQEVYMGENLVSASDAQSIKPSPTPVPVG